ncbi:MAG TPA: (d)CMP kinase [Patescibacteria group bacterium]|nr:(d)CMP kinase [Patescibacteria group bacterium]
MKGFAIAIDGPVAAGKGTIAPLLAKKLSGFYLYTGAMYRCLALLAIKKNVDLSDKTSILGILPEVKVEFINDGVFLNGEDVTFDIKQQNVANASSRLAVIPEVRHHMVKLQQDIAKRAIEEGKIVVAEGRDTATRVFPEARLKVFLTATAEERAKRRLEQLKMMGVVADLETVLDGVKKRDETDTQRETDPLVKNPQEHGYFVLDNTNLTEAQTLEAIESQIK